VSSPVVKITPLQSIIRVNRHSPTHQYSNKTCLNKKLSYHRESASDTHVRKLRVTGLSWGEVWRSYDRSLSRFNMIPVCDRWAESIIANTALCKIVDVLRLYLRT